MHSDQTLAAPVSIERLSVVYPTERGGLHAVEDLTIDIRPGEVLGIVGESGSGKTTVAQAILGLLPPGVVNGDVEVIGTGLVGADARTMRRLRRERVAAILQDPLNALNPVRRIRSQLRESARVAGVPRQDADSLIERTLRDVELEPARVLAKYPHQLSGGMNQRVAIAMALLKSPTLLIADEPTSALDVRTQASIMRLLLDLREQRDMAVMIVTHDLQLALSSCDRIGVMYAGRLVELGSPDALRSNAQHPYTQALLAASPRVGSSEAVQPIPGRFEPVVGLAIGCPFRNRCERATDLCGTAFPDAREEQTTAWCWHPLQQGAAQEVAR